MANVEIAIAGVAVVLAFVSNMFHCPVYDWDTMIAHEGDCVWSRVYGGSVAQDTTGSALGYDANSETMQSGVQWSLGEHWHLGASAAYEHTSFFGADNSSTIDGNDVLAGATVAYQLGGLVLAAGVNGGYGWYDSKRMVAFGNYGSVASASPNSWHAGVSGRVSYQLGFRNWYLKPWLDLEEIVIGAEGYVESGPAIFRLAVDSERRGNFVATPGLEIGTRSDLGARGILRPFASAGFGVISPDDWQTHARFADSPIGAASGFTATTPFPSPLGRVSLGADLTPNDTWDLKLQYDLDVGGSYLGQAGEAKVTYRF